MKDYGEEYPVYRVPRKPDTREIVIVTIILGICIVSFAAELWMPI